MNASPRAARFLRAMPDNDATTILDELDAAIVHGVAEPIGANCWNVENEIGGRHYRCLVAVNGAKTTLLSVSRVRGP